jgi:hypothetical protein
MSPVASLGVLGVIQGYMRRQQGNRPEAVRRVIEPRNTLLNGKVDGFTLHGRQYFTGQNGEEGEASPGSESPACYTMTTRQPGRPCRILREETGKQPIKRENAGVTGSRIAS